MHVILMGAQGSGKGTQAERLAPRLALRHVSTGNLFRAAIASGSDLGLAIKAAYDRGELIADATTVSLVDLELASIAAERAGGGSSRGALFDGFPRTPGQAESLNDLVARRGEAISAVIEIAVPLETLVTRLAGRRVCTTCGRTYHVEFDPPTVAGVCDRCGGEVIQREDDRPDAIARRLDLFFAQTEPLLAYYRGLGLLERVDGDQPVERVTDAIAAALARRDVSAAGEARS